MMSLMKKNSLLNWYENTDIKSIDKTLKLLYSKSRKFIDNFNRFLIWNLNIILMKTYLYTMTITTQSKK